MTCDVNSTTCPNSYNVPGLGTVCLDSTTQTLFNSYPKSVGSLYENGNFYVTYNDGTYTTKGHVVNKGENGEYFCYTGVGGCSQLKYYGTDETTWPLFKCT
jgi:hypothetical protein